MNVSNISPIPSSSSSAAAEAPRYDREWHARSSTPVMPGELGSAVCRIKRASTVVDVVVKTAGLDVVRVAFGKRLIELEDREGRKLESPASIREDLEREPHEASAGTFVVVGVRNSTGAVADFVEAFVRVANEHGEEVETPTMFRPFDANGAPPPASPNAMGGPAERPREVMPGPQPMPAASMPGWPAGGDRSPPKRPPQRPQAPGARIETRPAERPAPRIPPPPSAVPTGGQKRQPAADPRTSAARQPDFQPRAQEERRQVQRAPQQTRQAKRRRPPPGASAAQAARDVRVETITVPVVVQGGAESQVVVLWRAFADALLTTLAFRVPLNKGFRSPIDVAFRMAAEREDPTSADISGNEVALVLSAEDALRLGEAVRLHRELMLGDRDALIEALHRALDGQPQDNRAASGGAMVVVGPAAPASAPTVAAEIVGEPAARPRPRVDPLAPFVAMMPPPRTPEPETEPELEANDEAPASAPVLRFDPLAPHVPMMPASRTPRDMSTTLLNANVVDLMTHSRNADNQAGQGGQTRLASDDGRPK